MLKGDSVCVVPPYQKPYRDTHTHTHTSCWYSKALDVCLKWVMDTCHWKNFPNLAPSVRAGRVQFAMSPRCRHVLCYGKYSGLGPPAPSEFTELQHQTTHLATFMIFSWGFLPALPNCLLLKFSINKLRNATPLFGLELQLKLFEIAVPESVAFLILFFLFFFVLRTHLKLKMWALTGRPWMFGSIPAPCFQAGDKEPFRAVADALSLRWGNIKAATLALISASSTPKTCNEGWKGSAVAQFRLRCFLSRCGAPSQAGGSLHFVFLAATYTASISSHARNGAWTSFRTPHPCLFSCPHSYVRTKCGR